VGESKGDLSRVLMDALKREFAVIVLDEWMTTQVCPSCHAGVRVHGPTRASSGSRRVRMGRRWLRCTNSECGAVTERDVGACANMLTVAVAALSDKDPPASFNRRCYKD